MEASKLNQILEQHKLWIESSCEQGIRANLSYADLRGAKLYRAKLYCANLTGANLSHANLSYANLGGANLTGANLTGADLYCAEFRGANLSGANLSGAHLYCAYLNNAIGLPDISWIEPGILVQLNNVYDNFYVNRKCKQDNFIQDSIGIFIQNNPEDKTIDMLVGDRIIRNIPDWVKYSGMKQFTKESV